MKWVMVILAGAGLAALVAVGVWAQKPDPIPVREARADDHCWELPKQMQNHFRDSGTLEANHPLVEKLYDAALACTHIVGSRKWIDNLDAVFVKGGHSLVVKPVTRDPLYVDRLKRDVCDNLPKYPGKSREEYTVDTILFYIPTTRDFMVASDPARANTTGASTFTCVLRKSLS